MKKTIDMKFGNFYYNKFSKPIREKKDLVLILLETFQILRNGDFTNQNRGSFLIKNDKMSRVFYILDDKYYSILFPFILEENGQSGCYEVYDMNLDTIIDSKMISLMKLITDKLKFNNFSFEELFDTVYYDVSKDGFDDKDIETGCNLIFRMFSLELGYIRYDYDPVHENGDLHPLNHLDINYSSGCTYKLGLRDRISANEFVDLLDIKTKCSYISK